MPAKLRQMAPIGMTVSAPMWRNDLDVPGDHSSRPERFSHGGTRGTEPRLDFVRC
jgi:hypothetical protein